jgi:trehalose 6-phosphate synthase
MEWSSCRESGREGPDDPTRSSGLLLTDLAKADYQEYYNGYANRVLWPILHYRLDLAEFSRRDLGGYLRVNEHFAEELHRIVQPDDIVWVHDYHLLPLANALRDRGHQNKIGFFHHIPFPRSLITQLPELLPNAATSLEI